jgi:hypothetical protein
MLRIQHSDLWSQMWTVQLIVSRKTRRRSWSPCTCCVSQRLRPLLPIKWFSLCFHRSHKHRCRSGNLRGCTCRCCAFTEIALKLNRINAWFHTSQAVERELPLPTRFQLRKKSHWSEAKSTICCLSPSAKGSQNVRNYLRSKTSLRACWHHTSPTVA